ncbi:hypothetical protein LC613_38785 [Nostoc sphaeroides CHAB 2801]|uniref:hypothetical protein n=1 Tax=Nostoc sphaeroides TaxID=446679 RepID=UPI001E60411F|nr:hypothetical protein [Nostoc sphaeroides]MCC5633417.1 hypothetical protein [Nostoc sphaeroides CHAB 2801]
MGDNQLIDTLPVILLEPNQLNLFKVAKAIARIASSCSPRLRYRIGNEAQWLPRLRAILPDKLFRFGARKRLNLP